MQVPLVMLLVTGICSFRDADAGIDAISRGQRAGLTAQDTAEQYYSINILSPHNRHALDVHLDRKREQPQQKIVVPSLLKDTSRALSTCYPNLDSNSPRSIKHRSRAHRCLLVVLPGRLSFEHSSFIGHCPCHFRSIVALISRRNRRRSFHRTTPRLTVEAQYIPSRICLLCRLFILMHLCYLVYQLPT